MIADYPDNKVRVTTLASGREIADVMARETIDLLVFDLRLPADAASRYRRCASLQIGVRVQANISRSTPRASRVSAKGLNRHREDVADAPLGTDKFLFGIRGLEFPAQPPDLYVDRALVDLGVVQARQAEELVARQHPLRSGEERDEQVELVLGQGYGLAGRVVIAAQSVARAAPDGHTLLTVTDGTLAMNPRLYEKLPYDPAKDFALITQAVSVPMVIAIHPGYRAQDLQALIAATRKRMGEKVSPVRRKL